MVVFSSEKIYEHCFRKDKTNKINRIRYHCAKSDPVWRLLRSAVRCQRPSSPQIYLRVGLIQRGVHSMDSSLLTADATLVISNTNNDIKKDSFYQPVGSYMSIRC